MGLQVALRHRTEYRYEREVALGPQTIQLRPTPQCRTPILAYSLNITPREHTLAWQFDPLGNPLARVTFPSKTRSLVVEVDLVADTEPINPFAFVLEPGYESFPFVYSPELARDLEPYRSTDPAGPLLSAFVATLLQERNGTVAFLASLNQRVRDEITYVIRLEHGVQSSEETLALRTGSCRDSAWLLVQIFRQLGIAARFVSGYLIQLAADEQPVGENVRTARRLGRPSCLGGGVSPRCGLGCLDPTSGLFTAEGHIPLVCTPTSIQAVPIGGTVEPAGVEFSFSMSIRRLNETPSLAKPYSEEQWARVRELAHRIDRDLETQDVRLTMGGEPTFVGTEDAESPQWNIEALGPLKRARGLALIRRLRERTAPGGLLLFGQGKWYPGEALPRWAYHCISRKDGIPVWENGDLIASEGEEQRFAAADASVFIQALARRLQVTPENILPGYNPEDDAEERTGAAGFILPLRRRQSEGRLFWSSQLWFPHPLRLVLSPGDSPIGFRITTTAMPWVAPDELVYERNSEDGAVPLPPGPLRRPDLFEVETPQDPLPPLSRTAETATELIRPSLCVQIREGRLHVFLPYVPVAADYLDLVSAIEDTCLQLKMSVWLEGYPPAPDPRLRALQPHSDPGVLEVNLPPTSNWDELEELNAVLFDEALRNELIAGKFAYDGSHLGTGGGSHIVIGGASLADSPLLRRPDLLRSMVAFWQNHPSLSYLFSGMYVGPTSQYPRVDEARVDALYELEVSFSQLPEEGCPPDILDGLFRNLLVDVTGNTHRAEFCIDKLFPPEGRGFVSACSSSARSRWLRTTGWGCLRCCWFVRWSAASG